MELRDYQQEAVDKILDLLPKQKRILLKSGTGSGKTIMFNSLIAKLIKQYPGMRILMLVNMADVVKQTRKKFSEFYPEINTGVICSSLQKEKDIGASVIFSTIQSVYRVLNIIGKFDLIIIDEVQDVQPLQNGGMYIKTLHIMEKVNPQLRVLGVTATDFRHNHGYIWGSKCRKDKTNYFPTLDHSIGMKYLTDKGYLAPLEFMVVQKLDLSHIRKTAGEYNQRDLEEEMTKNVHLTAAADAYEKYGQNRKSVLVFCVTIDHAILMSKIFKSRGYTAEASHSKIKDKRRDEILEDFKKGSLQFLCTVGILLKAIDIPISDLALFCRPTCALNVFIQACGRLTRNFPRKKNALILDLSGNCERHGSPYFPVVSVPNPPAERIDERLERGQALKECGGCGAENSLKALSCWKCGYLWQSNMGDFKMVYVDWSLKGKSDSAEGFIDKIYLTKHHSFVSNNESLRVNVVIGNEEVSNFYSFQGKAKNLFLGFWRKSTGNKFYPETIDEAIKRQDEININYVIIKKREKYWKISSFFRK